MVHYWGGVCSVWLYYGGAVSSWLALFIKCASFQKSLGEA